MSERNYIEKQGLDRYANTDPSLHFNGIGRQPDERWRGAWFWCLRHCDYESAQLIHDRNAPPSDECFYGDHDRCDFGWCNCVCHARVQFELQHPQLKSLSEAESEREAQMEDAAA
jgi:hypothetical protein